MPYCKNCNHNFKYHVPIGENMWDCKSMQYGKPCHCSEYIYKEKPIRRRKNINIDLDVLLQAVKKNNGSLVKTIGRTYSVLITQEKYVKHDEKILTSWEILSGLRKLEKKGMIKMDRTGKHLRVEHIEIEVKE